MRPDVPRRRGSRRRLVVVDVAVNVAAAGRHAPEPACASRAGPALRRCRRRAPSDPASRAEGRAGCAGRGPRPRRRRSQMIVLPGPRRRASTVHPPGRRSWGCGPGAGSRRRRRKLPKPRSSNLSPRCSVSTMLPNTVATMRWALLFGRPATRTTSSMITAFVRLPSVSSRNAMAAQSWAEGDNPELNPLLNRHGAAVMEGGRWSSTQVGWRSPGQPRRWIVAVYRSVAAVATRRYARFYGGGRWRFYATSVVPLPDGTARVDRAGISRRAGSRRRRGATIRRETAMQTRDRRWRLRRAVVAGVVSDAAEAAVEAALPRVLFIGDLAAILRCSPATILRRITDGTFPLVPLPPIDSRLRWSRDRVLDWLATDPGRPRRKLLSPPSRSPARRPGASR